MIVPYKDNEASKTSQIEEMFDNISPKYDFLNHFFSLGIDFIWRKKAIKLLEKLAPKNILDIATGTGDFAIEALKLNPDKITGVDLSEGMMEIGKEKVKKINKDHIISFQKGDSLNLPFSENTFDAVIASFGVRNFENLQKGLTDMCRVTKIGGHCVVLEFSNPKKFPVKQFFGFYFKYILPTIGKLISKDSSAYAYLPESVRSFPDGEDFLKIFQIAGFKETKCIPLTFGISSIYIGKK